VTQVVDVPGVRSLGERNNFVLFCHIFTGSGLMRLTTLQTPLGVIRRQLSRLNVQHEEGKFNYCSSVRVISPHELAMVNGCSFDVRRE
jgi:hypothetical protein